MSLKYEPSSAGARLPCAGALRGGHVGCVLSERDARRQRGPGQPHQDMARCDRRGGAFTGPNPLYHRDDQVDRPRAMGV